MSRPIGGPATFAGLTGWLNAAVSIPIIVAARGWVGTPFVRLMFPAASRNWHSPDGVDRRIAQPSVHLGVVAE
jgi:hypothetical protein